MEELSIHQYSQLLDQMHLQPFFLNRLGGSDFISAINLINNPNSIDSCILMCSVMNGYYDTEPDLKQRHKNYYDFNAQLLAIYKNNPINLNACNFVKNQYQFCNQFLQHSKYVSYHTTNETSFMMKNIIFQKYRTKKILIISPFTTLIQTQIPKLNQLYPNEHLNIEFVFLETIITYYNETTQSYMNTPHRNFMDTVQHYIHTLNSIDFDVALLSCGSYAHFLGEHIKNIGKKAFYCGGILQFWFGIFGDGYLKPYFSSWFDLNYCILNDFHVPNSKSDTVESCNSYLYNEHRHSHKLAHFSPNNHNNHNLTPLAAKIHFLCHTP